MKKIVGLLNKISPDLVVRVARKRRLNSQPAEISEVRQLQRQVCVQPRILFGHWFVAMFWAALGRLLLTKDSTTKIQPP